jgi:serine/threonine protein kinase
MAAPQAPESGSVLGGDFTIVRPLSSGGMGAVFVAEQASTGKLRAIKLMHKELVADPKQRERFEQEARVGARIPSDHVVQVIAAGIDPATGAPWMAMELLEGQDLAGHLEARGTLPAGEVLTIFEQLCHALGAAHKAGIVHRDVKPENIFLAKTRSAAGEVSVKVLDFGIAKVVAESKTAVTAAIGTPLWMAPEQSDPRAPITPAADVWSLGLIAFAALTGVSYWKAASDPHAAMTALMREILFEPIQPASARAAELGRSGLLPGGFDAWFARCMRREPTARFATATEAFEALPAGLSGAPLEPTGPLANPAVSGLADLPTDAYIASMQGSTTAAPVTSTPAAGAGTNPSGDPANKIAMDVTMPAPSAGPSGRPRRAAALGGIAVALLAIAGGAIFFSTRPPAPSADSTGIGVDDTRTADGSPKSEALKAADSPGPQKTEPAAPIGERSPLTSSRANPAETAGGKAPKGSGAAQSASAGATPATAPRPFDHAAAARSVQQSSGNAKVHCRGKDGPKAIPATIYFTPAGTVHRVAMDPMIASKPSALCASMVLGMARVPAFDGGIQSYPAVVVIE